MIPPFLNVLYLKKIFHGVLSNDPHFSNFLFIQQTLYCPYSVLVWFMEVKVYKH